MARPKRQPTIVTRTWWPALKAKFLEYSFFYYPSALEELAVQVRENKMTLQEWAEKWGVNGTWIEQWAKETLAWWRQVPPEVDSGRVFYQPVSETRVEEGFSFAIINAIPDCRLAFGGSVGGTALSADEPADDWERFCWSSQKQLTAALEAYRLEWLRNGLLLEVYLDDDEKLDLKLQATAKYFFGKKSAREIGEYPGVAREQSVVSRWRQKMLALLDLKPAPRGSKAWLEMCK